jgi:antitoxin FitA
VDAQLAVKRSELLSFLLSSIARVVSVAALNIRNLDETVKRRLQVRAARHGRSMEAEVRAILAEAVREPADSAGLFTTLLDRFGALGGVDLDLPGREEPARAAEFSA